MKKPFVFLLVIALALVLLTEAHAALDLSRLLLHWTCDDGKGDKLTDASGNGWDAEIKEGAHKWVGGKYEGALQLQNAYAQVDGEVIKSVGETGEITMMCWFEMHKHTNYNGLISIGVLGGGCCTYRLMVNPNKNPFWNMGHHADKSLGNLTFKLDQWYHYALTGDGDAGKVYVDGEFIGEVSENFKLPKLDEATAYLGTGETPGAWRVEDSSFDDVMIWDKALSEKEVKEAMDGISTAVSPLDKLTTTWSRLKAAH